MLESVSYAMLLICLQVFGRTEDLLLLVKLMIAVCVMYLMDLATQRRRTLHCFKRA